MVSPVDRIEALTQPFSALAESAAWNAHERSITICWLSARR